MTFEFRQGKFSLLAASTTLLSCFLAGCSANFGSSAPAGPVTGSFGRVQGKLYGGQVPIIGGRIYLFAAGTTGYGSASTSLLQAGPNTYPDTTTIPGTTIYYVLTTGPGGSFDITGDYSCTVGTQVYIYAAGGNPGAGDNESIGLLAGLGECPAGNSVAAQSPTINVDEVSTIVTAYSLAGFATDALHIGSANTTQSLLGIHNAMANVANIMDLAAGVALTATAATSSVGTVPQSKIHALANILEACVNSSGSGACNTLFSNILSAGTTGSQPTTTADAAIYMAHNPANAPAAVFALQGPLSPFPTTQNTAPNDFSLCITYPLTSSEGVAGMAVDTNGDVYVIGLASGTTLSEYTPLGLKPVAKNIGTSGTGQIAFDSAGHLWVASSGIQSSVLEVDGSGNQLGSFTPQQAGNDQLDEPDGLAIDSSGNVWVSSYLSAALVELNSSGEWIQTLTGNLSDVEKVAIDAGGNAWVVDQTRGSNFGVTEFPFGSTTGTATTFSTGSKGWDVASDASGNIWVTGQIGNKLGEVTAGGTVNEFSGGGMGNPIGLAVDGTGHLFTGNYQGGLNTISEFDNSGNAVSNSGGFVTTFITNDVIVDPSGNVWAGGTNGVGEYLGLGSPTSQPLTPATAGTRP